MGIFLRKLWQNKPKQYGPWKFVHASLMENAEMVGINPADIALAMPLWNPGDQIDYSKNALVGTNSNVSFANNALYFGNNQYISVDKSFLQQAEFSFLFGSKANIGNNGYFISDSTDVTNIFWRWNGNSLEGQIGSVAIAETLSDARGKKIDQYLAHDGNGKITFNFNGGEHIETNTGSNFTSLTSDLYIGNRSDLNRSFNGYFYYLFCFLKELTETQIASLHDNPYQLWQPRPQVFYSFDAAPPTGFKPYWATQCNNLLSGGMRNV